MIGKHKFSWHIMLFSALWAYLTSAKTSIGFKPFKIVYGLEEILPIECVITSLKIVVELFPHTSTKEEKLLYLSHFDEQHHEAIMASESHLK